MANAQQIKKRKNAVVNIGKITNAMQLVSTAKSKRAIDSLNHSRDYYMEIERMLSSILAQTSKEYFSISPKESKDATMWILVSSNLGLCGGFNSGVFKEFEKYEKSKDDIFVSIGTKAQAYLKRTGRQNEKSFSLISDLVFDDISKELSQLVSRKVRHGHVTEVKVVFTEFVNQLISTPKTFQLYPLTFEDRIFEELPDGSKPYHSNESRSHLTMESEIDSKQDIRNFVDFYTSVVLYGLMSESFASEQVARRVSMENATNNSKDLTDQLNIDYNRTRQAAITQQITEIIGGSEE